MPYPYSPPVKLKVAERTECVGTFCPQGNLDEVITHLKELANRAIAKHAMHAWVETGDEDTGNYVWIIRHETPEERDKRIERSKRSKEAAAKAAVTRKQRADAEADQALAKYAKAYGLTLEEAKQVLEGAKNLKDQYKR